MTATTDIRAIATGGGANVTALATFLANISLLNNGYGDGAIPLAADINRILRQSSFMSAGLAGFLVALGTNVPDDGDLTNLINNLKGAFITSASLGNSGYIKFGPALDGLVIQWGGGDLSNVGVGVAQAVTLPVAFPNHFYNIFVTDSGGGAIGYGATPISLTQFNVYYSAWGSPSSPRWFAIGN